MTMVNNCEKFRNLKFCCGNALIRYIAFCFVSLGLFGFFLCLIKSVHVACFAMVDLLIRWNLMTWQSLTKHLIQCSDKQMTMAAIIGCHVTQWMSCARIGDFWRWRCDWWLVWYVLIAHLFFWMIFIKYGRAWGKWLNMTDNDWWCAKNGYFSIIFFIYTARTFSFFVIFILCCCTLFV